MNRSGGFIRVTGALASSLLSLPCEDTGRNLQSAAQKRSLTRVLLCLHSDLRLPEGERTALLGEQGLNTDIYKAASGTIILLDSS